MLIVAAFLVVVAMQPSEFRVERTITIAASPDAVFPHVNDLYKCDAWSPWAKLGPNAKVGFEGPELGEVASMNWVGNDEVGAGKMTITESKPNDLVNFRINFIEPFVGTSTSSFTFKPHGDKTAVGFGARPGEAEIRGRASQELTSWPPFRIGQAASLKL